MFKTILHFTKSQIIQTATSKMANEAMKSPLIYRSLFFLSQQKMEQSQQNITSHEETIEIENASAKFYKNSIRKVNINDKGRGKFTQHHLLNLIKLVKTAEEEPLLFEAYYNYLGHFTLFDSRVVDKMLQKSMSFQTCSISNILDIYKNHNYLAYFPHYNITRTLISLLQSQPQHYQKLINILLVSPLIKFDHQIIQIILEQINNIKTPYNIFSSLTKLIISRSSLNLLDQIKQKRQLLTLLTVAIKGRLDNQIFKSTKSGAYFEQWCNKILESNQISDQLHYELTIVGSFFQATNIFADNLLLIKDQKLIIDALLYLECSHPISQQKVVDYLQRLQISQSLRVRLNQFKQSKESDPSATQTQ